MDALAPPWSLHLPAAEEQPAHEWQSDDSCLRLKGADGSESQAVHQEHLAPVTLEQRCQGVQAETGVEEARGPYAAGALLLEALEGIHEQVQVSALAEALAEPEPEERNRQRPRLEQIPGADCQLTAWQLSCQKQMRPRSWDDREYA